MLVSGMYRRRAVFKAGSTSSNSSSYESIASLIPRLMDIFVLPITSHTLSYGRIFALPIFLAIASDVTISRHADYSQAFLSRSRELTVFLEVVEVLLELVNSLLIFGNFLLNNEVWETQNGRIHGTLVQQELQRKAEIGLVFILFRLSAEKIFEWFWTVGIWKLRFFNWITENMRGRYSLSYINVYSLRRDK